MSAIIRPEPGLFGGNAPLLAVYDLDRQEEANEGRRGAAFDAIAQLLRTARMLRIPIAHVFQRTTAQTETESPFGRRGAECRPTTREMVFHRSRPSCFSSEFFCDVARTYADRGVVFCGAGATSALASIIDARALNIPAFALTDLIPPPADLDRLAENQSALAFIGNSGAALSSEHWPLQTTIPMPKENAG